MLKDIIDKIIDAEARAEKIENDAHLKAQEALDNACLLSEKLKNFPKTEALDEAEQIINEAKANAEVLVKERLTANNKTSIDPKLIDKAADAIVARFLDRGL